MDFAFKVDVDTREGLKAGVPNILNLFKDSGVKATFFIPFGPDRTGVSLRRLWERKGMFKKASIINPLEFYGLPTLLYGTILPAPSNVKGLEWILERIRDEEHEIGVHGYDHVEWHDRLFMRNSQFVIGEIAKATEAYRNIIRRSPEGFAAPGWQMRKECYDELKKLGYLYSSSTRGVTPFIPEETDMLEIPTTLPTLDELYVIFKKSRNGEILEYLFTPLQQNSLNIHTIHAELEGRKAIDLLKSLIMLLKEMDVQFLRLGDLCKGILRNPGNIQSSRIKQKEIQGRPGLVTCQELKRKTYEAAVG